MDGSPYVHQAAVIKHHHTVSLNFIPTLNPSVRREIAIVALGDEAETNLSFYSSLHQQNNEQVRAQDQSYINPIIDNKELLGSYYKLVHKMEWRGTIE